MTELAISPDLSLPLEAVTETIALLAMRRAGKTNAAVALAEEMYLNGLPWVALDPVGSWWGIRATGPQSEGLPILVFGGEHGDLPLEARAGAIIADLVIDHNLTCVLDLTLFDEEELSLFVAAFLRQLFVRNRDPRHIFVEEADVILPQVTEKFSLPMLRAGTKLIKLGGGRGLGCTLITQRSASLSKAALAQVGTLIAMRTTWPADQDAVARWMRAHSGDVKIVDELPELADGEAFVSSPGWLGALVRVRFRRRMTYDSGATPKVGQAIRPPTDLADIDLGALREAMAATLQRVADDDPELLRKRIEELEAQIAHQPPPVPAISDDQIVALESALAGFREAADSLARKVEAAVDGPAVVLNRLAPQHGLPDRSRPPAAAKEGEAIQPGSSAAGSASDRPANGSRRVPPPPPVRTVGDAPSGPDRPTDSRLGKAERAVLSVLVQHGPQTQRQLAVHTGYSTRASTIGAALSKLRQQDLVEAGSNPACATHAGRELLSGLPSLPTGRALLDYWMARLGRAERAALELLLQAWPDPVPTGKLAEAAGYSPQASTMGAALSKLRTFGLVDGNRASDELAKEVR